MDLITAANDVLAPLGYEVLEVQVSSGRGARRVLVRIDRLDEAPVSVDDVRLAAEAFGLELDRLDPFPDAYRLEVESPGAERPLVRARHFERFHDLLVKLRVGDQTLSGRVRAVEGETLVFDPEPAGETRRIELREVTRARLAEWPDTPR